MYPRKNPWLGYFANPEEIIPDTAMVRLLLEWNVKFLYRQSDEMGWRFWVESGSEIESILENEDAKVKAFAMGMHTLVGDKSCVNYIDDDLLRLILGKN